MKVLIVFSSHLGSDEKFWQRLTDFNTSRNVDGGGILYVFNGKEYHGDGRWKISALKDEIKIIIDKENDISEYAVLLHTQVDADLLELIEACDVINVLIFKKFSTYDDLFKNSLQPLDLNSPESFNKLWKKLKEDEVNGKAPMKGAEAEAKKLAEYISNHNCKRVIRHLKIPIGVLKRDTGLDRKNGRETILDYGKDFVQEYCRSSMCEYMKILKVFPDNPEINKIPEKLADANERYATIYDKAKTHDNNSNKVIVENGQIIIRLHEEIIDILKKEVLQNREEDL